MKNKIIGIILCSFLLVGLVGCGNSNETANNTNTTEQSEQNSSIKNANETSRMSNIEKLSDIEGRIQNFKAKVDKLKITKGDKNNKSTYTDLNEELESLDNELDVMEDDLEILYKEDKMK